MNTLKMAKVAKFRQIWSHWSQKVDQSYVPTTAAQVLKDTC